MRLAGTRSYYRPSPPKMPPGLVELMEGLTKEVLKNNPTDIYAFCANHVQHLLEIRDGPLRKTLTLEEKVAKAQQKIRQRADKRKQEYDKNLLLQQINSIENNVIPSDVETSSSNNDNVHEAYTVPIIHHELNNLSEVEISHDQEDIEIQQNESAVTSYEFIDKTTENKNNIDKSLSVENEVENYTDSESAPDQKDEVNHQDLASNNLTTPEVDIPVANRDVSNIKNVPSTLLKEQIDESLLDIQDKTEAKHSDQVPILSETVHVTDTQIKNQESAHEDITAIVDEVNYEKNDNVINNNETENSELMKDEIEKGEEIDISNTQNTANKSEEMPSANNASETINANEHTQVDQSADDVKPSQGIDDKDNLSESKLILIDEAGLEQSKYINDLPGNDSSIKPGSSDSKNSPRHSSEINEPMVNTHVIDTEEPYIDHPTSDTDGDGETLVTDDSVSGLQNQDNGLKNDENNGREPLTSDEKKTEDKNISSPPTSTISNMSDSTIVEDKDEISTNFDEDSQTHSHKSNNMDLETAAVTIQKVFRNFLFKSRASTFEESVNDDQSFLDDEEDKNKEEIDFSISSAMNMDRRAHGITRMDTVLQTVNEEKSLSLSTDDSSTLSSAATIIQAHVRGFLVRNRLNSNKTLSSNSLPASNSNEPSLASLEAVNDNNNKNKTVLNIHIVPEGSNYLSRDESLITSMDLSLDGSPPSSINLHPLGYDKSERRKQLKREDAIQSISPPSNNSGKLSEDVESVKDLLLNDHPAIVDNEEIHTTINDYAREDTSAVNNIVVRVDDHDMKPEDKETVIEVETVINDFEKDKLKEKRPSLTNSDEMDVVTAFIEENPVNSKLIHSGEFHDAVLPTKVSRNDTTVVREFKNVLVYFFLWNNS